MMTGRIDHERNRNGNRLPRLVPGLLLTLLMISSGILAESPLELSVGEVRRRALQDNRGVQAAREDVNKAKSEIVTARAGALPEIRGVIPGAICGFLVMWRL